MSRKETWSPTATKASSLAKKLWLLQLNAARAQPSLSLWRASPAALERAAAVSIAPCVSFLVSAA